MNNLRLGVGSCCAVLCLLAACSDKNADQGGRPASTTANAGGASGTGGTGGPGSGSGTGGSGTIVIRDASYDPAAMVDATCAGSVSEATLVPLDLFIMLDQSSSMKTMVGTGNDTRWTAVTKAIANFVQSPEAKGLGVGINYFGIPFDPNPMCFAGRVPCMRDTDCAMTCGPCVMPADSTQKFCQGSLGPEQCNANDYAKAETAIAPLPGNAQAILTSLAAHKPSTGTPTSAGLKGATDFCRQWAMAHPDRVVVNVFATDGEPAECELNDMNIIRIAGDAFMGTPSVRTFVIGVGNDLATDDAKKLMDGIAQSGGTMKAFLVSDADVNRQFLAALNKIRGAALSCTYAIPDSMGSVRDYNRVNVRYTAGGSTMSVVIPKVADAAACSGRDGWYYDNDAMPTRIMTCDATCQSFSMDSMGKVQIEVGCVTIVASPR